MRFAITFPVGIQREHSETLLQDDSTLTVLLNDSQLASIPLTAENAGDTEVVLALPLENLDYFNFITFAVTQHVPGVLEDPFDPSLWTRVSRTSFIEFSYRPRWVEPELAAWPSLAG